MSCPSGRKRHAKRLFAAAAAAAAVACAGEDETPFVEGVIDRETFVQVYVDLRDEAVRSPELTITEEARDAVLTRHGVDEDDLLAFVDAYGREIDYMNDVWAEVEQRLDSLPPVPRPGSGSGA